MLQKAAQWPLWQVPRRAVILIFTIDLLALMVPVLRAERITFFDVEAALALGSLSIAYSTLTRITERARRALHIGMEPAKYQNLLGVWTFAAAVMLPPRLAFLVIVAAAMAEWPARQVVNQARLYRYIYSTAGVVLAGLAAHGCAKLPFYRWLDSLVAVSAYIAVGLAAVVLAMLAVGQREALGAFTQLSTYKVELYSLAIALAEIELVELRLAMLVWLSLPVAFSLQRYMARAKLLDVTAAAQITPMSEEAWVIAATQIVAMLPMVAVMRINCADVQAVNAVAQIQTGCDAIGSVGDGELAILLVDCPGVNGDALAARVRAALHHQGVEASVAVSAKPRDGQSLEDLLAICEAELVARDAVRQSPKSLRPDA